MTVPAGMNPTMYEAMALRGEDPASYQDDPEAMIPMTDQRGQETEADPTLLAAEGMHFSGQYMNNNGPRHASHSLQDREAGMDQNKMTKAQLKEQVMNEDQGYPSNLGEANQVKALENKVTGMEQGIAQILKHLSSPSSPEAESNESTSGSPASPDVPPTPMPEVSVTVSPQNLPSIVSDALNEPDNKQPKQRQVTLKDGRKISVPAQAAPMSLGPATGVQECPPTQLEADEFTDDPWDEQIAVIPEEPKDEEPKVDPALEKVVNLVQEVNGFMQGHDVHRFWRRQLSSSLHRHVGYNGWPKKLQKEFDTLFQTYLSDPTFVSSVCRKIISMELGHALGVKQVVSFLVSVAGFTAFALIGIDG